MNWRRFFGHRPLDREIDEELAAHLAMAAQDREDRGEPRSTARRQAALELGGRGQVRERVQDVRSAAWLDRFGRELRDAFRAVRRTPGIALTSAALIALVVGGNITIFSAVYAILTKPARGVHARRLVTLESRVQGEVGGPEHSYSDYAYFAASSHTVRSLMAEQFARFTVGLSDASYACQGGLVSTNYFETLGVRAERGRLFTERDDQVGGLVAVVSHRLWQERLHGVETAIGTSILVNGHAATIIGVAAPDFYGAWFAETADVWVPLLAYARTTGTEAKLQDRSDAATVAIGQLIPSASLSAAQAEFATLSAGLQTMYPETNRRKTVGVVAYSVTAGGNSLVAQGGWRFLAIFTVVTGLTVLIVCANVANLMLARAIVRQREVAVRQSLGASRGTIVRSLLLEGGLIALVAWVTSCVFATWMANGIGQLLPLNRSGAGPPLDFSPDWRVLAYAMLLALLGAIAFTLPPALRTWRLELLPWLKAGEQGIVQGRSKATSVLVVLQLTFAVVLLTSAGLAYRSLWLFGSRDLGFAPDHLLLATVNTAGSASDPDRNVVLLNRITERLRTMGPIRAATYARAVPSALWQEVPVKPVGREPDTPISAQRSAVGPEYLQVLGLKPLLGRELGDEGARAPLLGVINQNLADALWPGESPVGRSLQVGTRGLAAGPQRTTQTVEVVGVSPNALFSGVRREARPNFLLIAERQQPTPPGEVTLYIRHDGPLDSVAPAIGAALRDVDGRVAIVSMRSMATELDGIAWPVRFLTRLLVLFALTSLTIATLGQYAVVAFDVRRRTRDFGVRMALGASAWQVLRSVLGQGFRWTAVGLAFGLALSLVVGRAARAVLFGVTPTDGLTYIGVFVILAMTSFVACYLPARRAAQIDPMRVLRQE